MDEHFVVKYHNFIEDLCDFLCLTIFNAIAKYYSKISFNWFFDKRNQEKVLVFCLIGGHLSLSIHQYFFHDCYSMLQYDPEDTYVKLPICKMEPQPIWMLKADSMDVEEIKEKQVIFPTRLPLSLKQLERVFHTGKGGIFKPKDCKSQ